MKRKRNKLTKTAVALIMIGALMSIMDVYFHTFLVARFYELASNSTEVIAKYYIRVYIMIAFSFVIFGNFSKKHSKATLRTGIVLNAVVLILIMSLEERVIENYQVLAIIFGLAQGCYYSPISNLIGINTVYKLVSAVFICILTTLSGYARYESLDKRVFSGFDAEHQSLTEMFLAAGRVSGFCALLMCSRVFVGILALQIFLVVIGAVIVAYSRYIYKTIK